MNRRAFLKDTPLVAAGLALGNPAHLLAGAPGDSAPGLASASYPYRIAFGAWINDLRMTPLPLENWPAPQFDDEAVASAIRAMDVQAQA